MSPSASEPKYAVLPLMAMPSGWNPFGRSIRDGKARDDDAALVVVPKWIRSHMASSTECLRATARNAAPLVVVAAGPAEVAYPDVVTRPSSRAGRPRTTASRRTRGDMVVPHRYGRRPQSPTAEVAAGCAFTVGQRAPPVNGSNQG